MPQAASEVRITGPLAPHAEALRRHLVGEGYTPLSAVNLLRLAAHLSRWLIRRRVSLATLSPSLVRRFVHHRRQVGYTGHRSTRGMRAIVAFLVSARLIRWEEPVDDGPYSETLRRYACYLARERGLTPAAVRQYRDTAARFLAGHPDLCKLVAADITGFVLQQSRRYSVGSTKYLVTVLRSLLRYLHVVGEIATDLTGAVPQIAGWRMVGLPKDAPADDVRRLLQSCPRGTAVGRRDYAILLLLSRLGLRACEAATLTLDDLRWTDGEIAIRGKGSESRLPLTKDIGSALVAYLRVRRHAPVRSLFLRVRAPQGGLSAESIKAIVLAAGRRAGVALISAHRLRHTTATAMLRKGASLSEIAQVLRHRSPDTTAIYAKVDTTRLRAIARPWLGGSL